MQIDVTYDSSVANAPAGFTTVVADVVKFFDAAFTNPITVNIAVGWGEVDGQALSARALGESISNYTDSTLTYAQVRAALLANAISADAKQAGATLGTSDPTGGGAFAMTTAEARALGLMGASSGIDGYAGFSSTPGTFDFSITSNYVGDPNQPGNEYDFFAVVAHEFSEILGRQMNFGKNYFQGPGDGSGYYPLDLFDYSAPDTRDFSPNDGRYFSINGGNTTLGEFNRGPNGDRFDWDSSYGPDAFNASSSAGVINSVTANDLILMNVLGYQPGPDFTAPATPVLHGPNFTFDLVNSGGAAPASTTAIYVCAKPDMTTAPRTLVASYAAPALAAGGAVNPTVRVALPASLAAGIYYLAAEANADNGVAEADTANNLSPSFGVYVLDSANLNAVNGVSGVHSFDLAGVTVSGAFTLAGDLTTSALLGGAGSVTISSGQLYLEPGTSLTVAGVSLGQASSIQVDTGLTYAGAFVESQGTLTVAAGDVFTLGGASDTISSTITGAGTLDLAGGGTTFEPGANNLRVANVSVSGAATTVTVATSFAYSGRWTQSSGTLTVASGDSVSFDGVGDSFAGTLGGAGQIDFGPGADTLHGATITAAGVIVNGANMAFAGANAIDSKLTATSANLTVAATGASFRGGGTFILTNLASNRIEGATASATLNLLAGTIRGAGDIGGGQMALYVGAGGTIHGNDSVALVLDTGSNSIINHGLIEATGSGGVTIASAVANGGVLAALSGNLTVDAAVSGGGSVRVNAATAEFAAAFSQNVAFGATGELELARSQAYGGTISGFSHSGTTSLDLLDIAFGGSTTASFSGTKTSGVLTVTDTIHTARIKLAGNYLASTFTLSGDGHGGTSVVDPPATPTAAAGRPILVTAMAAFAPASGPAAASGLVPRRLDPPVLVAAPHTATA